MGHFVKYFSSYTYSSKVSNDKITLEGQCPIWLGTPKTRAPAGNKCLMCNHMTEAGSRAYYFLGAFLVPNPVLGEQSPNECSDLVIYRWSLVVQQVSSWECGCCRRGTPSVTDRAGAAVWVQVPCPEPCRDGHEGTSGLQKRAEAPCSPGQSTVCPR